MLVCEFIHIHICIFVSMFYITIISSLSNLYLLSIVYVHLQVHTYICTCAFIPFTINTTIYYIFWNALKTIAVQLTPLTTISLFVYIYKIYVYRFAYQFPTPADQFTFYEWVLFLEFTYTNIYLKALTKLSRIPSLFWSVSADNPNVVDTYTVCQPMVLTK